MSTGTPLYKLELGTYPATKVGSGNGLSLNALQTFLIGP